MQTAPALLFSNLDRSGQDEDEQWLIPGIGEAESEERKGRYTAARLLAKRPDTARMICHYLAQDVGLLRIAKLAGVHHQTVAAIQDQLPAEIDMERQRLAGLARTAAALCMERIIDEVEHLPRQTLGLTAAQLIDKFQVLTGGATSRVERVSKEPSIEDFGAMIAALPSAEGMTLTDTGSGGENPPQMAAGSGPGSGPAPARAALLAADEGRVLGGAEDGQSVVSLCPVADATDFATPHPGLHGCPPPPVETGGEGVADPHPPPSEREG
jgi:hypothetical protein